jgi:hypothetical protein
MTLVNSLKNDFQIFIHFIDCFRLKLYLILDCFIKLFKKKRLRLSRQKSVAKNIILKCILTLFP